ncbi:MAG: type 1 glutamine amidotransferase [Deltaproteobacteria bacterium]|nr:type 1 glutamine amidotransferase [Deltaproteobacteria bacterium]
MRVHYLQHVPFEGLGSIHSWLESRSAEVTVTRLFEEVEFPNVSDIDWLIVMGGPMSANDETTHPWLIPEKRFIAEAISSSRGVLGICLGAQLIANSLGAKVVANPEREIGWLPIERAEDALQSAFASLFQEPLEVFHWQGETFELPPGAIHLARSTACENQAFSIGNHVLGLQFHLETTAESARRLIENCPGDLAPGRWVQSGGEMLEDTDRFVRINHIMGAVLSRLEEPSV